MIRTTLAFLTLVFLAQSACAEVLVDIDEAAARKALGTTTLDDLSINDTALVYSSFCLQDHRLFIPGWTVPANLAGYSDTASGVIFRVSLLPGKKLKGAFVDAAQAQKVAKGETGAAGVLTKEQYNTAVRQDIGRIFNGGVFGTSSCEEEQRTNLLRKMTLFEVESINEVNSLSALLESVSK